MAPHVSALTTYAQLSSGIMENIEDLISRGRRRITSLQRFEALGFWATFACLDITHGSFSWQVTTLSLVLATQKFWDRTNPTRMFSAGLPWGCLFYLLIFGSVFSNSSTPFLWGQVLVQSITPSLLTFANSTYPVAWSFCCAMWLFNRRSIILDDEWKCGFCLDRDPLDDAVQLDCNHLYHRACLVKYLLHQFMQSANYCCGICRAKFSVASIRG